MCTALARHTRYHYTVFLHIKTLKESEIFKHHLNLCYSGVILASDLVILPGLFWFLGSCFSVKDWVRERFGRLLENSGTGFSLLKNRSTWCLSWSGVSWCCLHWGDGFHIANTLFMKKVRKKLPSWLIHAGYWVEIKGTRDRPATRGR